MVAPSFGRWCASHRRYSAWFVGLIWSLAGACLASPPNILVILADDLGYGDVSALRPSADIQTPNIDRLAAGGMLFTQMRANCTVCSPTRAALMSGRYADRVGMPGMIRDDASNTFGYFDPNIPTLANLLQAAGYNTGIVGKWNLGLNSPNTPNERGFQWFHGFLDDMMDSYTTHLRHGKKVMRLNNEVVEPSGHATDIFTTWACDYIRDRSRTGRPFFLYLAYNAPHFPIEPPAEWLDRVRKRTPSMEEKRALNVALVEHLDFGIGRVMDTLKESGVEGNTLVFLTSDNGGYLPVAANNDPWRGGKTDFYDGGLKVPFIVRWPGTVMPGGRSDYEGLVFDIFATAIEAAGSPMPIDSDAVSLGPILRGQPSLMARGRELYFALRQGGPIYGGKTYEAIVRDRWKLMQNNPYLPLELYNLAEDPQEKINLVDREPKIATQLKAALRAHIQQGGATPWQPPMVRSKLPLSAEETGDSESGRKSRSRPAK